MTERTKDWIYKYFYVGFFWSFFSTMFLLALNSISAAGPISSVETLIFFVANWAIWPVGMGFVINQIFGMVF